MRRLHLRNLLRYWHNTYCCNFNHINWWKTLQVNFMLLPFNVAYKFPILIYGKCKLGILRGTVIFLSQPYRGMLKIGVTDPFRSIECSSYMEFTGTLYLGKEVTLRRGLHLSLSGVLILNNYVYIGDCVTIKVVNRVRLGSGLRVGNNTTIMDSDFHYIINLRTRDIKNFTSPIEIGDNNWIGGNCIIKKGTKTPIGTIVAGPFSMLSKDYTTILPEYSLIAGSPAKLLIEGVRRVNNIESEKILNSHFKENNDPFNYTGDIDEFCLPKHPNKI